jgi:murein L,D-transpeptidase YcbB/YkuD
VDNALDLAAAVLAPAFSVQSLQEEADTGRTRSLLLGAPLPIYALYITASSADGAILYAEDIYQRDAELVAALDAPRVRPTIAARHTSSHSECARAP